MQAFMKFSGPVALVLLVILAGAYLLSSAPVEAPVQRSFTTGIYMDNGGDKLVAQSGGEVETQSGSTVDIQTGTSMNVFTYTVTWTDPITITGVITNVRLLYYAVP